MCGTPGCRCGGVAIRRDTREREAGGVNDACHTYTGGVTKHEGRVLATPFVYPLFWGSAYAKQTNGIITWKHPCVASAHAFLADLMGTWLTGLNQYGVESGGNFFEPEILPLAPGTDPTSLSQPQIEAQLIAYIKSSQVGVPDPEELSRCYLIFLPPTASLAEYPGACGYHGHTLYGKTSGDSNLFYAVISTDGVDTSLSGDAFINQVSYCVSHELAEMFTNPDDRGWFADADPAHGRNQQCEIGDICETRPDGLYRGRWQVEQYWSQKDNACLDPATIPVPATTPVPSGGAVGHGLPHPPPVNCAELSLQIGKLITAMEHESQQPHAIGAPATSTTSKQLAALQAEYQKECLGKPVAFHPSTIKT